MDVSFLLNDGGGSEKKQFKVGGLQGKGCSLNGARHAGRAKGGDRRPREPAECGPYVRGLDALESQALGSLCQKVSNEVRGTCSKRSRDRGGE